MDVGGRSCPDTGGSYSLICILAQANIHIHGLEFKLPV